MKTKSKTAKSGPTKAQKQAEAKEAKKKAAVKSALKNLCADGVAVKTGRDSYRLKTAAEYLKGVAQPKKR